MSSAAWVKTEFLLLAGMDIEGMEYVLVNSVKINTSMPLPPLSMCRAAVLFAGEGTLELLMGIRIYNILLFI
jgi:hypothetical protein